MENCALKNLPTMFIGEALRCLLSQRRLPAQRIALRCNAVIHSARMSALSEVDIRVVSQGKLPRSMAGAQDVVCVCAKAGREMLFVQQADLIQQVAAQQETKAIQGGQPGV